MKKLTLSLTFFFVFALYNISLLLALYPSGSSVVKLDAQQFEKKILSSKKIFLVEFYQDWCGHCKNFAPEYEKVADAFSGIIPVVATDDQSNLSKLNIQGFPTIKLIVGNNGKTPTSYDYNGNRDASSIISFVLKKIKEITKERLKIDTKNNDSKAKDKEPKRNVSSKVIELTDDNFQTMVMNDIEHTWFIKFYAPWCKHCTSFAPMWGELAEEVSGPVMIGKLDATKHQNIATKFDIKGFPTLKLFPKGKKSHTNVKDYKGPRSLNELKDFCSKFSSSKGKPIYIDNDQKFKETCRKGVCVVSFFPRSSNPQNSERMKYLDEYNDLATSSSDLPINFLWAQGGDHFEVENQLNLAFGYPAVVAFSLEKSAFIIHRGGFSKDSLISFLNGLMIGQLPFDVLPENFSNFNSVHESAPDPHTTSTQNEEL